MSFVSSKEIYPSNTHSIAALCIICFMSAGKDNVRTIVFMIFDFFTITQKCWKLMYSVLVLDYPIWELKITSASSMHSWYPLVLSWKEYNISDISFAFSFPSSAALNSE